MCHGSGLQKPLSTKSDFSQMHLSRSEFDSDCKEFRADLNLNECKEIGLIRCLILNVPSFLNNVQSHALEVHGKNIMDCCSRFLQAAISMLSVNQQHQRQVR